MMNMRMSIVHSVENMIAHPFGPAWHPVQAKDRLGNPKIDFPIGIAFGDRDDTCDSADCDTIVKNNQHFASGRS